MDRQHTKIHVMRFIAVFVFLAGAVFAMSIASSGNSDALKFAEVVAKGSESDVRDAIGRLDSETLNSLRYGRAQNLVHAAVVNHEHPEVIYVLDSAGIDLGAQDADGRTPLHHAIDSNNIGATRILLELGASLTKENEAGLSPSGYCQLVLQSMPQHETCRLVTNAESRD